MAERIGTFVLLVGVSIGISLVLAGCSGTKETSGTNEFFFQPVDTLRQMQGRGQQALPGGGNIPQGDQQQAAPRKKDATEELLISQTAVDTITPKLRFLTSIPELKDSILNLHYPKDIWGKKYFQFGSIRFPNFENSDTEYKQLIISGRALKKLDGNSLILNILDLN